MTARLTVYLQKSLRLAGELVGIVGWGADLVDTVDACGYCRDIETCLINNPLDIDWISLN